ncbi:MAG: WD40 repeat domain-containing protein [Saprospiraceae bacterium]
MQIEKIHTSIGHQAALYALAPGHDDRHFLSAGGDGWIVEWSLDDPETGRLAAAVETRVFSLLHLPAEKLLLAGNMTGGVHWVDLADPARTRNVQHHRQGVYDLLVVGGSLYSAGGEGLLTRWSVAERRSVESVQLSTRSLRSLAYSASRDELAVGASDGNIYLLEASTLALRRILPNAHLPSVFTVAYSPDQSHLLSGGRDAMLRVWDAEQAGPAQLELPAHRFTINHLAFSPDGRLLVTASRDKTFKIWDAHSYELLKVVDTLRFGSHINSVNRLLWLPDALVTAGDDRSAMLWRVH